MEKILAYLPPADNGYLPYYLLILGTVAIGNAAQNLTTLHFTRRIYNGRFVPDIDQSGDSVRKLKRAPPSSANTPVRPSTRSTPKPEPQDQVTPLAARLFGVYTALAGVIRVYAAYDLAHPALYQMALLTHLVAAAHFTSEALVFGTVVFSWEHLFPLAAAFSGSVWMLLQYSHYVG